MEKECIQLLRYALSNHASDVHFSLKDDELVLQMRCKEKLIEVDQKLCSLNLFRYLQYRANLDVSNKIKPQSGQFEMEVDQRKISLRFSIIYSLNQVSGVLRILNTDLNLKITDLTMNKKHQDLLKKIGQRQNGLFLISGPTGSGKTTTMYTVLNEIKAKKIFTLEDPIEIHNDRYIQLQINEKQNLDYEEGIKQLLRHDPDVIVLGEIRDIKAAQMAMRCALTGHLVISTIHASSCIGAIERILELGVSTNLLKEVLFGVSNQRLLSIKNKKGKTGVYEIIGKEEVIHYLQTGKSAESQTLNDEIQNLFQHGFITSKQAKTNLS